MGTKSNQRRELLKEHIKNGLIFKTKTKKGKGKGNPGQFKIPIQHTIIILHLLSAQESH